VTDLATLEPRLETYRVELTGYCYRMLGAAFEAEDAVQETMLRAWRSHDRFDERRAPLRTWLYSIATNVCLDMLRSAQRRAVAMDLGGPSAPGPALGVPLPEHAWVRPVPDARVLPAHGDPAELAEARESIRLAFVAALQHLVPRQRAVLILRDVLCWQASEVAQLLDTTVASVNSALQRARAALATRRPAPVQPADEDLLARYLAAFQRYDVDALVALLREDATMSMPPFPWWLRGREAIRQALLGADACRDARVIPTRANGSPAFGQYLASGAPFALVVLDVSGGSVLGVTTYLDAAPLFPLFDLPR
jgi:RNA polymerase sigma-70 factor (ECF subfamily)